MPEPFSVNVVQQDVGDATVVVLRIVGTVSTLTRIFHHVMGRMDLGAGEVVPE